ncbi:MAG: recombinase family protein [Methylocella sp.]
MCEIVDRLQAKGVALRILNMNLDTNDATGKLMLQIIMMRKPVEQGAGEPFRTEY